MPIAFVLLNVDLGTEGGVIAGLRGIEGVKEAWQIYGVYDIIAEIEAEDMEKVKGILQEGMRRLDGIRSTLTLMAT
jgi:DNA-binding Lrp family transcriptional regulator